MSVFRTWMASLGLAVALVGCGGGSTPTTPSIPPANIQSTGQGGWINCGIDVGCQFSAAVQNTGTGCAIGTAVVARFYDANGAQVGSDTSMGIGLNVIIQPGQTVPINSTGFIAPNVVTSTQTYHLYPTWNNVACP